MPEDASRVSAKVSARTRPRVRRRGRRRHTRLPLNILPRGLAGMGLGRRAADAQWPGDRRRHGGRVGQGRQQHEQHQIGPARQMRPMRGRHRDTLFECAARTAVRHKLGGTRCFGRARARAWAWAGATLLRDWTGRIEQKEQECKVGQNGVRREGKNSVRVDVGTALKRRGEELRVGVGPTRSKKGRHKRILASLVHSPSAGPPRPPPSTPSQAGSDRPRTRRGRRGSQRAASPQPASRASACARLARWTGTAWARSAPRVPLHSPSKLH